MPIFEYICEGCEKKFELLVLSSKAKAQCPDCGSRKVKRQFSTFAAHQGASGAPSCAQGGCPGAASRSCAGGSCPFSS